MFKNPTEVSSKERFRRPFQRWWLKTEIRPIFGCTDECLDLSDKKTLLLFSRSLTFHFRIITLHKNTSRSEIFQHSTRKTSKIVEQWNTEFAVKINVSVPITLQMLLLIRSYQMWDQSLIPSYHKI